MRGDVKFWNGKWGIIKVDNQTQKIFVHWKDLVKTRINEFRKLKKGQFVRFKIKEGKDGKRKAINVQRLYVRIFSANDIYEYHSRNKHTGAGKNAKEWLDSTLNPGEFVEDTEFDGIPLFEDDQDAKNYPVEELVKFLDGVGPAEELVSRLVEFKLALQEGDGEHFEQFQSFLQEIEKVLYVKKADLEDMDKFSNIRAKSDEDEVHDNGAYPIEQLIELITTKGQDELIERMRQWNSHVETYPFYAVNDFSTILKDVESALTTNPDKLAQFKTFLEENEKMIRYKANEGFFIACTYDYPGGHMVNPKDNGKYHRLVVDHLRDSPRSESWQNDLLAILDEFKKDFWDDLINKNDSWVEYFLKKEVVTYPKFFCCMMALEFVKVVEFDPPGGCLEDPLDLVDFGSEVELVGKYDINITRKYKSDKILVSENGLTVLKDYRQRKIGTRLVRQAEEFIKSKFRTRTVGGPTKICFLVHCDNHKSLSLFRNGGYNVVTNESKNVQDFKNDFAEGDPKDKLSVDVLKETTIPLV